jgi:hypothetical protein
MRLQWRQFDNTANGSESLPSAFGSYRLQLVAIIRVWHSILTYAVFDASDQFALQTLELEHLLATSHCPTASAPIEAGDISRWGKPKVPREYSRKMRTIVFHFEGHHFDHSLLLKHRRRGLKP